MNSIVHFIQQYPFLTIIISFIIGKLFMPVAIKIAKKHNFLVKPNKRTSHKGLIPYTGGLDIFVSFFLTMILFSYEIVAQTQFIILGTLTIFFIGFVDDLITLKPMAKLSSEIIAGIFLIIIANIRISHFHGILGINELPLIMSYLFSLFTFIVIVNALNLIDGVDGLASGLGIIYNLFFGIYFNLSGYLYLALAAYTLAGSLIVFFIYNVFGKKNKIFMGDTGALFLGFMITFFVFEFCEINAYHKVPEAYHMSAAPAVAICLIIVPLFDTFRVMLTRIKKGFSPFKADKNHIHHLLLKIGFSHRQVTLILLTITIFFTLLALIGRNWNNLLLIFIALLIASSLTYYLWRVINKKMQRKTIVNI